jgi:nitroreductase
MTESTDRPTSPPRPLTSVPVAPHGHQIQPAHLTVLPEEDGEALARLAEILAQGGVPPGAERLDALRRLCGACPAFLDGWARLSQSAYAGSDALTAYAYARVGYHRGLDRLRRHGWGGTGQVRWEEPSNRGFLRSLYMLMLAAAAIGEADEATRCRQFLLDLDPDDGIGVGGRPLPRSGELVEQAALP